MARLDVAREREDRADGHLGDLADPLDEVGIVGRRKRGGEDALDDVQADHAGLAGDLDGNGRDRLVGDERGERVNVGVAEGIGVEAAGVVLGEDFPLDDGEQQRQAALRVLPFERGEFAAVVEIASLPDAVAEEGGFRVF